MAIRQPAKPVPADKPSALVDTDSFEVVMTRENRTKGFFVGFGFSTDALAEISSFFRKTGKIIQDATVKQILGGTFLPKLA